MKRVLCILSSMNAGGAETFLMKIYRKIDCKRYQMDFCVNVYEKGFYDSEILEKGGRIFHIPSKSDNLKEFKKQLTEIIKSEHYEYVLRITSNTMGFMDLKIAKKAGARICAARSSNSCDPKGIKSKLSHQIGRILYGKYVDVKIAPSDLAARYTFGDKAYECGKVSILHNAVDLEAYKYSDEHRSRIRDEFGIKENDILCGHVGRFSEQKNHKCLIKIFHELCQKQDDCKLLLVGKGELEDEVRKQCMQFGISDKVIFAGIRSDIPAVLSAMDVFVFPSLYEGMPNAVIEAEATGLPCVISDSITRDVNITGRVAFCSLHDEPVLWTKFIKESMKYIDRNSVTNKVINSGYDINEVVKKFQELIFEK